MAFFTNVNIAVPVVPSDVIAEEHHQADDVTIDAGAKEEVCSYLPNT